MGLTDKVCVAKWVWDVWEKPIEFIWQRRDGLGLDWTTIFTGVIAALFINRALASAFPQNTYSIPNHRIAYRLHSE